MNINDKLYSSQIRNFARGVRTINGDPNIPSLTFLNALNTGIYYSDDELALGISIGSIPVIKCTNSSVQILKSLTLSGGLSTDTYTFTGATGANTFSFPDNLADALSFKEGSNFYMTFVSTDGAEQINLFKSVNLAPVAKSASPSGSAGDTLEISTYTFTDSATAGSGTATAMVFNSLAAPTLAATNTSVTTTDSATLYIGGAPIAGTNQTLTNAYALWVDSGDVRFDGVINMSGTQVLTTQQTAVTDAAVVTTVGANTGTSGVGLSLIGDTSTVNQATNIMNDFVALQEDILDLRTQLNDLLAKLRTHGIIAT